MSKKILVITEGKEEERLFNNIIESINDLMSEDYEIIKFNNPIYELYELIKDDQYFDIVQYLILKNKDKLKEENPTFSQVYLIFDYDHQYHKYSDEAITKMIELFDNETDNGKLYINYPMLEASYHLKSQYDKDFYNSTIEVDKISSEYYKKLVNSETYVSKSGLTKDVLKNLIKQHYLKLTSLMSLDYGKEIDYKEILELQIKQKNEKKLIYILATMLMMVYDHNPEETLKLINVKYV